MKKTCITLLGNCLGMVIVSILLGVAAFKFLFSYTHHGESVVVPNLVGTNMAVAEKNLSQIGLSLSVIDTGFVRSLPPNIILDQSINPGDSVKQGRVIEVTINASHARLISVPDVADNCSLREAEAKLKVLGFKLTPPKYTLGDKDWVYGLELNGRELTVGQKVNPDLPITLVVGNGNRNDIYNGNDSLDYIINGNNESSDYEDNTIDNYSVDSLEVNE